MAHQKNYGSRGAKGAAEQTTSPAFLQSPKGVVHQRAVHRKRKGDGGSAVVQRKLTVGQPGDVHEKEADAMANKVVRRLATSKEDEKLGTHDARMEKDKEEPMKPVHRKQKPGDKDKEKKGIHMMGDDKKKKKKGVHKKDDPKKKKKKGPEMEKVHRKEKHSASEEVSAEITAQAGKGNPLPKKVLTEMNHQFGMDFSHVRIHTDATAAHLCNTLNAQAFTHGCDIYFNEGKFNPESQEGKLLLAHELTHVAQQG